MIEETTDLAEIFFTKYCFTIITFITKPNTNKLNKILTTKPFIIKPVKRLHKTQVVNGMSDSQRCPRKLCLVKNELDIRV